METTVIPKLYDEDYLLVPSQEHARLDTNGYGFLNTCTKCEVTEDTSGKYTLDLEVSINDEFAEHLLPNTFIKVKPNAQDSPQLFQVYSVKEDGNKLTVKANHIKYLALNNVISRFNLYRKHRPRNEMDLVIPESMEMSASDFMSILYDDDYLAIESYSPSSYDNTNQRMFSFSSNITSVTKRLYLRKFTGKTLGDMFNDSDYGLGQFDGEWKFDNFNVSLLSRRGNSFTVTPTLRLGSDIKKYAIEYSSDNNYNCIVPIGKVKDENGNEFYLSWSPEILQNSEINKYPRVKIVDVSKDLPTLLVYPDPNQGGAGYQEAFNAIGVAYKKTRNLYSSVGYEISINVTLNYNSKTVQSLGLYDPVRLVLRNGKTITSQVTEITYDSLTEKIKDLKIGQQKLTLEEFFTKKRR